MNTTWIVLAVVAVVLLAGYGWYVSLIRRRNQVREALGAIDAQLQKRHDLVPNVLKIASRFMEHESELMEQLTALRAKAQGRLDVSDPDAVQARLTSEAELGGALGKFFAVAENYPDLRSSETMLNAQNTYAEVEANIAAARRFYNSAVADLNNAVEIWPGSMIAGMVGVAPMPFFKVENETVRQAIDADSILERS